MEEGLVGVQGNGHTLQARRGLQGSTFCMLAKPLRRYETI
jgi:hypothetical protein